MNAEQYLNEALGGNMNIGTLKPLAWHEIMEDYARHKLSETQAASTNTQSTAIAKIAARLEQRVRLDRQMDSEEAWQDVVTEAVRQLRAL